MALATAVWRVRIGWQQVEQVPGILKAFVITSGAILVVGALALAVLIVVRAAGTGEPVAPALLAEAPVELELPAGGRIEQVIPSGERLLLLGSDRTGGQFLLMVDSETGGRLRLIRFRPAPRAR